MIKDPANNGMKVFKQREFIIKVVPESGGGHEKNIVTQKKDP